MIHSRTIVDCIADVLHVNQSDWNGTVERWGDCHHGQVWRFLSSFSGVFSVGLTHRDFLNHTIDAVFRNDNGAILGWAGRTARIPRTPGDFALAQKRWYERRRVVGVDRALYAAMRGLAVFWSYVKELIPDLIWSRWAFFRRMKREYNTGRRTVIVSRFSIAKPSLSPSGYSPVIFLGYIQRRGIKGFSDFLFCKL